jgi:superfamily I DNA and RNA helicase
LIAKWIKDQIAPLDLDITVREFHVFMFEHIRSQGLPLVLGNKNYFDIDNDVKRRLKDIEYTPEYGDDTFWEITVPETMLQALHLAPIQFDKVIVDEGQDLLKGKYLDVIDQLTKGGLLQGNWVFFVDFCQDIGRRQHIPEQMREMIIQRGSPAVFSLSTNCRNTVKIGRQVAALTHRDMQYKFTGAECPDVRFAMWRNKDDQAVMLNKILKELIHDTAIEPKNIVLLLMSTHDKSTLFTSEGQCKLDFKIAPYDDRKNDNVVSFTSIGRFKGMESQVVILCDVDTYQETERSRNLMYVGLSRARVLLIVLESEKAREERCALAGRTQ